MLWMLIFVVVWLFLAYHMEKNRVMELTSRKECAKRRKEYLYFIKMYEKKNQGL